MQIPLGKAIEILDLELQDKSERLEPDTRVARRLGIQALKAIQSYRRIYFPMLQDTLPDEEPPEQQRTLAGIRKEIGP